MRSRAKFLIIGVFVAAVVAGLLVFLTGKPAAPPPLPNPNGYDDFVKAGQMIVLPDDVEKFTAEQLRPVVEKNKEALALARNGLTRESRVPVYSPGSLNPSKLMGLKSLAKAFAAEARLARLENRFGDAAASCVDTVRMGQEASRGGPLIDSLVGTAIEAIGVSELEKVEANLDAKQCRDVISALEAVEARRDSVDKLIQQERAWSYQNFGLRGQIVRLFTLKSTMQMEQKAKAKFIGQRARTQQLMVRLAERAYELEKGAPPQRTADLIPGYLKAMPKHVQSGTNTVVGR